jgi:hypothetical protein
LRTIRTTPTGTTRCFGIASYVEDSAPSAQATLRAERIVRAPSWPSSATVKASRSRERRRRFIAAWKARTSWPC